MKKGLIIAGGVLVAGAIGGVVAAKAYDHFNGDCCSCEGECDGSCAAGCQACEPEDDGGEDVPADTGVREGEGLFAPTPVESEA